MQNGFSIPWWLIVLGVLAVAVVVGIKIFEAYQQTGEPRYLIAVILLGAVGGLLLLAGVALGFAWIITDGTMAPP